MIKDKLSNTETYFGLSEGLKQGFEWLKNTDLEAIKDGRYEISGSRIYVNVQTYETKTYAKYEAHRKYADIQYMIKGKELIGVCPLDNCKTCTEYDKDKDIEFFDSKSVDEWQTLNEGEFLVLFPQDAHKPSISDGKTQFVKKAVVKVLL